jgi:hypothetical protein
MYSEREYRYYSSLPLSKTAFHYAPLPPELTRYNCIFGRKHEIIVGKNVSLPGCLSPGKKHQTSEKSTRPAPHQNPCSFHAGMAVLGPSRKKIASNTFITIPEVRLAKNPGGKNRPKIQFQYQKPLISRLIILCLTN